MAWLTVIVPGPAASLEEWQALLAERGRPIVDATIPGTSFDTTVRLLGVEDGFHDAFARPDLGPELAASVADAPSALMLDLIGDLLPAGEEVAGLLADLDAVGGRSVLVDESALVQSTAAMAERLRDGGAFGWYRSVVVHVTNPAGDVRSCGMHVFDRPDVEVPPDAADLVAIFNLYQLAEDPILLTGDTFTPDVDSPRRRLVRWPDVSFPEDDNRRNPFGRWYLGPADGSGPDPAAADVVFMPALTAILRAAEAGAGRALEKAEVDDIVDGAVCMTMDAADVRELERARGYADLEPERAFEQWDRLRTIL